MESPQSLALAPSAPRTATGSGAAIDGDREGRSGAFTLLVTASSGTGQALVVSIEESHTGLDDWTSLVSFRSLSGASALRVRGVPTKRYLRAAWTIDGTTPSFTFEVKGKLYDHLISFEQLEAHMSPTVVARIFDDSRVGVADDDAVNSVLEYASNKLRSKIAPHVDLSGFTPETRSELIGAGLDIADARAAMRHPEVVRKDGVKLMQMAKKDLLEIRLSVAGLGSSEPDAPDNGAYGYVESSPKRDNCW